MTPQMHDRDGENHRRCLLEPIFRNPRDFGAVPAWLQHAAERLRIRYDGVNTTREFQAVLRSFGEMEHKPFEIFVVGEGKFGKSTILNALLGQELSKVAFLPATRSFLRFVPSPSPIALSRVFTRFAGREHDWLRSELGKGSSATEFFEVREHLVPGALADKLLAEESERCKKGDYSAAILELEKEVPVAPHATLPPRVRIVDTQGLNQLFTDELVSMAESLDAETSTLRFEQWMATTARGKHLEWQLRRCDAILWVAHARRPSSAVTLAALRHFSRYGKSVVLAVTNIDAFDGDATGRAEVLASIEETYKPFVTAVVPVNGKKALQGVVAGDVAAIEASGLSHLAYTFKDVVFASGTSVRAAGLYNALRATEKQLRRASVALRAEHEQNVLQLEEHRTLAASTHQQLRAEVNEKLDKSARESLETLRRNLGYIKLEDGPDEVRTKLNEANVEAKHQAVASRMYDKAVEGFEGVIKRIASTLYRLPTFDAEGKRSGDSVSPTMRVVVPRGAMAKFNLRFNVPSQLFGKAVVLVGEFLGNFFQAARDAAADKRSQLEREKQAGIADAIDAQWPGFASRISQQIEPPLKAMFSEIQAGLDRVERQLESQEGAKIEVTIAKLDELLGEVAVEPILVTALVRTLRRTRLERLALDRASPSLQ